MKTILEFLQKQHSKQRKFNYKPKTRLELKKLIDTRIQQEGIVNPDLNDIDISDLKDLSSVFAYSDFNGDISEWDVSGVENMASMFYEAQFDGDISEWDVSNVKDMSNMFEESEFSGSNGDLSNWQINKNCLIDDMFSRTPYDDSGKSPKWYVDYMNKKYN